jgi:fermentation-respiration switch protein FrsA (DUF1100 family)
MTIVKWTLIAVVVGYGGLAAVMFFAQRALMYFPEAIRIAPAEAGLPEAEEIWLDTADGERVVAWHVPPRGERPVVLYFHGNGGSLRYRAARFREIVADGTGLLALSYRGFGGSGGKPTEAGLIADARALYDNAVSRYEPRRLALWGESLGSGVAVALAAERPVGWLILEAPFSSAADIGQSAYPFVPVRLFMLDQFRSNERIGRVGAPVLVLHGERDTVIPIVFGERLYRLITSPKRFVRFPAGGHSDLGAYGAVAAARQFLAQQPAQP